MELPTGHTLNNRFRIIRLLGKGGMGSVYYAHDPVLNRYVAIKQLLPIATDTAKAAEQMRKQFLREAQVLASLHHSNLPRVTDYFIEDDVHYLIMDYIEGQSLSDMLLTHRQGFPEDQVLDWADQLLSALEYIHSQNVIHRDIKPANIRRTTEGRIFLVDFGLVKPYNLNDPRTMTMFHGLGTPEYAPPEQYEPGVHTDQRSDIYALGATLYHLLTGKAPLSVTRRISEPSAFDTPREANGMISPEVERVIVRAMELERVKRFATASDMRAALELVRRPYLVDQTRTTDLSALAVPVPAVVAPRPDRRRRAVLLISVPFLLFLGVGIGIAVQASTNSAQSASTSTPAYNSTPVSTIAGDAIVTGTPSSTPSLTITEVPTIPLIGSITPDGTLAPDSTATPRPPKASTQAAPAATNPAAPAPTKARATPPGQASTKVPPGQTKKTPSSNSSSSGGSTTSGGTSGGNTNKPTKSPNH